MKKMKHTKTFLTLLSLAGVITVITMTVANTMTTHLEKELTQRANTEMLKTVMTPKADTTLPKASPLPAVLPSPTPVKTEPTPAPTPAPTPKKLHLVLPVTGAEVLTEHTEDMLVFQATYGDYRAHLGIDFGGEEGTTVYAAADGIVVRNDYDYEKGYTVELSHEGGYTTTYSNLGENNLVAVGQVVLCGEPVGIMGDSGVWESHLPCHLHFEFAKDGEIVNPEEFLHASLYTE